MGGLEQLNALAQITTPLHSLTITPWGNPITRLTLFRPYALYRLHHLSLAKLNGEAITDEEVICAEQLFGRLGQLTTSKLTQARLLALVSKHRLVLSKLAEANGCIGSHSGSYTVYVKIFAG